MRERVDSTSSLILDIPGYPCDDATITIPRPLLESIGLDEDRAILLRFGGEGTGMIGVIGQAGDERPSDPNLTVARPDLPHAPDYPPTFVFKTTTAWLEAHRIKPGDITDNWDENLHRGVHEGFELERSREFVRPDGKLVIPV
jgi:hypothetical protein